MKLRDHAENTARSIFAALDMTPSETQRLAVADLVEQQLIGTAVDTRNWCADHVIQRSKVDKDTGQQVSSELRSATEALITNLSSLR